MMLEARECPVYFISSSLLVEAPKQLLGTVGESQATFLKTTGITEPYREPEVPSRGNSRSISSSNRNSVDPTAALTVVPPEKPQGRTHGLM